MSGVKRIGCLSRRQHEQSFPIQAETREDSGGLEAYTCDAVSGGQIVDRYLAGIVLHRDLVSFRIHSRGRAEESVL